MPKNKTTMLKLKFIDCEQVAGSANMEVLKIWRSESTEATTMETRREFQICSDTSSITDHKLYSFDKLSCGCACIFLWSRVNYTFLSDKDMRNKQRFESSYNWTWHECSGSQNQCWPFGRTCSSLEMHYHGIDLMLPYTDVRIALYTQCFPSVCGKNFTGDSGGIRTHDLLLTSADVLTSQPPSLPDDPLLYRILAGLSSSCKLGGREVKTSALVSRRSWDRIPPESPVKFFPHTRKAMSMQCYTHVGVMAKLNKLFVTRHKNFVNLSSPWNDLFTE